MLDNIKKDKKTNSLSKKTILLVEDEFVILDTISEILGDLGYQVLCASDGIEACIFFDQNPQIIDLVIVDYTLPKRSGVEVIQYIQSKQSDIIVILCSGCAQSEINDDFLDHNDIHFLAKPYEISQVINMIEAYLN